MKYSRALAKCGTKFTSAWQKLEDKAAKAGATCADGAGTGSAFQAAIDDHTDNIATALDGGELAGQGRLLRTEQTTCYDSSGSIGRISCELT